MKKFSLLLGILLLFTFCTYAEEDPQLPDVGVLLGVEGELYRASQEKSGPYHTYLYEVEMTIDEAASIIVDYTEAAREAGFTPKSNATEGVMIKYMSFSAETGMADLALYVAGKSEELANGEAGTLWFALAVPDCDDIRAGGWRAVSRRRRNAMRRVRRKRKMRILRRDGKR